MEISPTAPKRPLIRYPGSKMRATPWILQHIPRNHLSFNVPFGGSAIELLLKQRSEMENYNDLCGDLVNLLQVLRDHPEALINKIKLTYWARAEHELALTPSDDLVEQARRFYTRCWLSYKPFDKNPSFRRQLVRGGSQTPAAKSFAQTDHLWSISERLKGVNIECLPALEFVKDYDYDGAVFLIDPPYVHDVRKRKDLYEHEMTDADHRELANALRAIKGMAIVCGYTNSLYAEEYENYGWVRVDSLPTRTNGESKAESLWLNPLTVSKLEQEKRDRKQRYPLLYGGSHE